MFFEVFWQSNLQKKKKVSIYRKPYKNLLIQNETTKLFYIKITHKKTKHKNETWFDLDFFFF